MIFRLCSSITPAPSLSFRLTATLPSSFRLTATLPCDFDSRDQAVVIPKKYFHAYNAQCVVNLKSAFWGLLLPVGVEGRVSDIWRGYIVQKLLWDIDEQLAFLPSLVVHERMPHDYLKDFQSESDLYLKTGALVKFLSEWKSSQTTLAGRMEGLWIDLYERGFLEQIDIKLMQAWIRDLISVGYSFPPLVNTDKEVPGIEMKSEL